MKKLKVTSETISALQDVFLEQVDIVSDARDSVAVLICEELSGTGLDHIPAIVTGLLEVFDALQGSRLVMNGALNGFDHIADELGIKEV